MTTKQNEALYLRVWIGNLGKYNEGHLVGEWFDLPCDFSEVSEKIGLNERYEEYQINDFETNITGLSIHHYDNIKTLNEFAERLNELDETQQLILQAHIDQHGTGEVLNDFDSVNFDDAYIYHDVEDMEDVAREWVEQTGLLEGVPDSIERYFDYEAYGRDLEIEGTFVFLENSVCVQLLH